MLYMLGQIVFDINKNLAPTYLIKVGLSRKIKRRINCYKSDNPSAILISTTAGVEQQESTCHRFLAEKGKHYSGEWYEVNKDFFLECLREGFNHFPKKDKKQNVYHEVASDIVDKVFKYYKNKDAI